MSLVAVVAILVVAASINVKNAVDRKQHTRTLRAALTPAAVALVCLWLAIPAGTQLYRQWMYR